MNKPGNEKSTIHANAGNFTLSDFYNNSEAQLLFFKLNFQFENTRANSITFSVKIPRDEIGLESIPIGCWISNSSTNEGNSWSWTMHSMNNDYFFVSGFYNPDEINPHPRDIKGVIGIVLAYKK